MGSSGNNYSEVVKGLDHYGKILCPLIEELLRQSGIQIQSVTHRVKSEESVQRKLSLNSGKYKSLEDLHDLLGVRVITYFSKDVDRVAEVIRGEFAVDDDNSVDKRKLLDPDKFGYLSLHFVASLASTRAQLAEYKSFSKIKFEIQARSILQHAWAEIEHDLGYKAEGSVPDELRRSFSRLAGLLELADEEFERIRGDLGEYEKHVEDTIDKAPQALTLNQSTVVAALEKDSRLLELDVTVAEAAGKGLDEKIDTDYAAREATQLRILGVENLEQLVEAAAMHKQYVSAFAKHWLSDGGLKNRTAPLPRGIGIFYLGYVLAAQKPDIAQTKWGLYLRKNNPKILEEIGDTWAKITKELGQPKR